MIAPVFLDTVGLLALWDKRDKWHPAASDAYKRIRAEQAPVFATSFVLLEAGNAAARRPYRLSVLDLKDFLEASGGLVIPSHDDWRGAWEAYRRGEAGDAGIVDQVSFAVMRRLNIPRAFSNDRHFHAGGFETLF